MTDHKRLDALIAAGERYLKSCKCRAHGCPDLKEEKRFEAALAKAGGA